MPSSCAVPYCESRMGGHRFPRDRILREKWIAAIRRVNFVPSEYSIVCKKHFKEDDYRLPKDPTQKKPWPMLKKNTVPSKFSWNDHNLRKQKRNQNKLFLSQRCSVLQCKSASAKNVILHTCPNQESVRKKWAEVFKVNREVVKSMLICSNHFLKTDYIKTRHGETRILKQNAVPSQKLPRSTRVIHIQKKVAHKKTKITKPKNNKKEETMNEVEKENEEEKNLRECRTCLKKMEAKASACNLFQCWAIPWTGMAPTIAEDLAKLANIEISELDKHSKVICEPCYQILLEAASFAAKVRVSDQKLRERYPEIDKIDNSENNYPTEEDIPEKVWPKPIQVDKNLNGEVLQEMDIEIKQEVVSDDEYNSVPTENAYAPENGYAELELDNMDIKIEPEEIEEPPPLTITIQDTMSLTTSIPESKTVLNGSQDYEAIISDRVEPVEPLPLSNGDVHIDLPAATVKEEPQSEEEDPEFVPDMSLECMLCTKSFNSVTGLKLPAATVKEEPQSEEEDPEFVPDMSLECMLCTKSFNSVTGLKAHVIAQHSYKSVKRKAGSGESPQKKPKDVYKCEICRRAFLTSTDLMVHETCHNKHSCYGCSKKFDSFKQLSKHRRRCKVPLCKNLYKPKTIGDVLRPIKEEKMDTLDDSNDSSMKLHLGIHSAKSETASVKSETEVTPENNMDMSEDCT